jgi:hypothetical protein
MLSDSFPSIATIRSRAELRKDASLSDDKVHVHCLRLARGAQRTHGRALLSCFCPSLLHLCRMGSILRQLPVPPPRLYHITNKVEPRYRISGLIPGPKVFHTCLQTGLPGRDF